MDHQVPSVPHLSSSYLQFIREWEKERDRTSGYIVRSHASLNKAKACVKMCTHFGKTTIHTFLSFFTLYICYIMHAWACMQREHILHSLSLSGTGMVVALALMIFIGFDGWVSRRCWCGAFGYLSAYAYEVQPTSARACVCAFVCVCVCSCSCWFAHTEDLWDRNLLPLPTYIL